MVDGRFRGRASRGSDWSYRLENHGKRSRSLASKSWTTRGSSTGGVQMSGRSAKRRSIDVNLCSVCVAVSTARFSRTAPGDGPDPNRARAAETGPSSRSLRHNASGLRTTSGRSEVLTRGFRSSPHAPKHTAGKAPVGASVDPWDEDDHRNRRPQRLQVAALRGVGRGVRSPHRRDVVHAEDRPGVEGGRPGEQGVGRRSADDRADRRRGQPRETAARGDRDQAPEPAPERGARGWGDRPRSGLRAERAAAVLVRPGR